MLGENKFTFKYNIMKNNLLLTIVLLAAFLAFPKISSGQAPPNLGSATDFAILSTAGAVTSSSTLLYKTHVTGDIGAAPASISGFGNVDGVLYQGGTTFASASTDVNAAYAYLAGLTPTNVMATPFGGGTILNSGVHSVVNAAIWFTGDLILDAQNNPNAVFIFQLDGALNVSANSKVKLINGAQACNVFWMVDGAVTVDVGVTLQGTIITQGAILMGANDSLVGRAFAINSAISVNETTIYIPLGCGRPILTGPALPVLNSVECYAIFSSNGPVQDDFATFVIGDVGSNLGSALGYDPLKVTGTIHPIPDGSTAQCAADLLVVYNNLNALPYDIQLMEPSIFGHNLVLTPHTYLMLGAVSLTDTLYLDAQGNPNAVFIFQINGAFATSTFSNVVLLNGAQAQNVYWKIDGAVDINNFSIFNGTFVCAGAINLFTGVILNGRALTTVGALSTYAAQVNTPSGTTGAAGVVMGPDTVCQGATGIVYYVSAISNATSYSWTLPLGVTIISGANTDSITVDFSPTATTGTFNITVQGSSACGPGTVSANFQVEVVETPIIDSVSNQMVCHNDTTTNIIFTGTPLGTTYNWTNNNTAIGLAATGNGDILSFTATNNGTTIDTALITVTPSANGCVGASISFTIIVNPVPIIDTIPNQSLCAGETTSPINFNGNIVGTSFNWTNNNTTIGLAANGNGNITSFTAINNGTTIDTALITVTPSLNGCNGISTSFTIIVAPVPTIDTVASQSLCNNDTTAAINFSGNTPGAVYNWTNDNTSIGLAASGSGNINAFTATNTGASTELATITVTPSFGGCEGTPVTFTIEVTNDCDSIDPNDPNNDFNIPEGFSPNGDDINDLFVIRGIDRFPSNSFMVFNRWGDKLFEANPYTNTWDGTSSTGIRIGGDELPVGTYFYVLDLGDESAIYKGTIYLNR